MKTVSPALVGVRSRYQPIRFSGWFDDPSSQRGHDHNWHSGVFAEDDGNDDETPPPESPPFDPGGPPVHTD